ncbi:MAG: cysteine desulfurase, partial [Candidatus Cloacimonadota bacterium]
MKKIYFNNCLTYKPAPEVVDAMLTYLKEKFYFPGNFIETGETIAS